MVLDTSLIFHKEKIANVKFLGSDFLVVPKMKTNMINPEMIQSFDAPFIQ